MELRGKTVVLTGASRGIGRALSIALAKAGCRLLLTALEDDELATIAEQLSSQFAAKVDSIQADLTDISDRRRLLDLIGATTPPPDILVSMAGAGCFGRFDASKWDDIDRLIELNVRAPLQLTREMIPILGTRPEAKIVIVSSAIARLPYPGLAVYGAAKGFLSSFCESLTCELVGTNISVLCFHPGFTTTHFMPTAGFDLSGVPKFMIRPPEVVAGKIVRAIKKDKTWAYADFSGRFGVLLSGLLTRRAVAGVSRHLYWRLPDDK